MTRTKPDRPRARAADTPAVEAEIEVDALALAIDRAVVILSAIRRHHAARHGGRRLDAERHVRDYLERETLGKSLRDLGAETVPPRSRSAVAESCARGKIIVRSAAKEGFSDPFDIGAREDRGPNERRW